MSSVYQITFKTFIMKIKEFKQPFQYLLFVLLSVFLFIGKTEAKTTPISEDPYKARNLTLKNQKGELIKLNDLEGKVVFINFWATWCPPCIAEMPNINKLYQQYQDDDQVVFLMISLDRKFETAVKFLDQKGYAFDIQEPQGNIPRDFNTRGIPITYVLGKNGEIEYTRVGMGNYNTQKFKEFLEELKAK